MSERMIGYGEAPTGRPVQLTLPLQFVDAGQWTPIYIDPEFQTDQPDSAISDGATLRLRHIPLAPVIKTTRFRPQVRRFLYQLEESLNGKKDNSSYVTAIGYMYALYQSGASAVELAEAFGFDATTITKIFKSAGLSVRSQKEAAAALPSEFVRYRINRAIEGSGYMRWYDKTQQELAGWLEDHPELHNKSITQLSMQTGTEANKFATAVRAAARRAHPGDFEARLQYVYDIIPASARKLANPSYLVWNGDRITAPSREQAIAAMLLLKAGIVKNLVRGEYKRKDYDGKDPANYEVYTQPGAQYNLDFYLEDLNMFIEYHPLNFAEKLLGYSIEQVKDIRTSHITDPQYKSAEVIMVESLVELREVIDRIHQLRTGREIFGGEGEERFTNLIKEASTLVKPILKKNS